MNIYNDGLYCFDKKIDRDDIIAYDVTRTGCLYLTEDGMVHYIGRYRWHQVIDTDKLANKDGILDLYLLSDNDYILIFRDRFEYYEATSDHVQTFNVPIKPDFHLFKACTSNNFCYINGGEVYTCYGDFVCAVPDCKFVWSIYYQKYYSKYIVAVGYIDNNEGCIKQLYRANDVAPRVYQPDELTNRDITKIINTEVMEIYSRPNLTVMYCRDTKHVVTSFHGISETCKFETNGYEWMVSTNKKKYYCSNSTQITVPIDAELFRSGHHIIRPVPTKSARF